MLLLGQWQFLQLEFINIIHQNFLLLNFRIVTGATLLLETIHQSIHPCYNPPVGQIQQYGLHIFFISCQAPKCPEINN
jgi:hypothetical protein